MPDLTFPLESTVFGSLWLETVARIQDLALEGIDTERVVMQQVPWLLEHQAIPCVIVCPDSLSSDRDAGTNERDDTVYRFIVSFVFANERDITTDGFGLMAHWVERTKRAIQNKSSNAWPIQLPEGSDVLRRWIPDTTSMLIEEAKRKGLNAMYLAVAYECREPRT